MLTSVRRFCHINSACDKFSRSYRGILLQNQNKFEAAITCYHDAIKYRPRLACMLYFLIVRVSRMSEYGGVLLSMKYINYFIVLTLLHMGLSHPAVC